MKSDRRHELQTNTLADWVGTLLVRYRPMLPTIGLGALAALAVLVALGLWIGRSSRSAAQAWGELHLAGQAQELKRVAEKFRGTDVALWARLDLADLLVHEAKDKLATDRDGATTQLREAQQTYAEVLEAAASRSPEVYREIVRRAAIAEAKCWELLGDREKAIERYRTAASKYTSVDRGVALEADRLATELEKPEAADFYKWLAQYRPPAAAAPKLPTGDMLPPLEDSAAPESETSERSPGTAPPDDEP